MSMDGLRDDKTASHFGRRAAFNPVVAGREATLSEVFQCVRPRQGNLEEPELMPREAVHNHRRMGAWWEDNKVHISSLYDSPCLIQYREFGDYVV